MDGDAIVINKADGDNKKANLHNKFNRALHLFQKSQDGYLRPQLVAITQEEF
jgi:putative protein kinase ArgK-like GTPase of G3E family